MTRKFQRELTAKYDRVYYLHLRYSNHEWFVSVPKYGKIARALRLKDGDKVKLTLERVRK